MHGIGRKTGGPWRALHERLFIMLPIFCFCFLLPRHSYNPRTTPTPEMTQKSSSARFGTDFGRKCTADGPETSPNLSGPKARAVCDRFLVGPQYTYGQNRPQTGPYAICGVISGVEVAQADQSPLHSPSTGTEQPSTGQGLSADQGGRAAGTFREAYGGHLRSETGCQTSALGRFLSTETPPQKRRL